MKTLLKKMKIVTMCSILLVISFLVNSQNKKTFPVYALLNGDSIGRIYYTIDFEAMSTNNQLSNNICTAIRKYYWVIDLLNVDVDKRAFQQVASTKWTWDVIDSLLYGKLDNIDSNIAGSWEVLHSPWLYDRTHYNHFLCRTNHEQYGFTINDTVWGVNQYNNIVEGILEDTTGNIGLIYHFTDSTKYWNCDINTIFDKQNDD